MKGLTSPKWGSVASIRRITGCDPGYRSGAILTLEENRVIAWVGWARGKGEGWRFWSHSGLSEPKRPALGANLVLLPQCGRGHGLALEGTFGPLGHEPAEAAGHVLAAIQGEGPVVRPLYVQWATQLTGIGRPTDETIEGFVAESLPDFHRAVTTAKWGVLKPVRGALYDAAGLALWARG